MTLQSVPSDDIVNLANQLADCAGGVIRRYFRTPFNVETKPDMTPVTIADREAEAAMRQLIEQHAPDHGIYGEEFGPSKTDAEWVWVLDPIDGTKAFITGKPSFGILIALLHCGEPVLGIIDQPILKERWLGISGKQTTLNNNPIHVRPCPTISLAAMYATAPYMFKNGDELSWNRLTTKVKLLRYGADCYAYGLLAAGFIDLVVEASLQPYDYLPLIAIIEGAGGVITDWQGQRPSLSSDGHILAASDINIHREAQRILMTDC